MGKYSDIDAMADRMKSNLEMEAELILEALNERTSKAMDDAMVEFGEYQKEKITEIFNEAVDRFYSAYSVVENGYQRQGNPAKHEGGLYEVLEIQLDDDGTVYMGNTGEDYTTLFDQSKMHKDRHGGDLFNKVFMSGWHGGAESGDGHPQNGTPYWRTPIPIYSRWGRKARKTTSPYTMIARDLGAIEGGEMFMKFKEISQYYNDKAVKTVIEHDIPDIKAKIYG